MEIAHTLTLDTNHRSAPWGLDTVNLGALQENEGAEELDPELEEAVHQTQRHFHAEMQETHLANKPTASRDAQEIDGQLYLKRNLRDEEKKTFRNGRESRTTEVFSPEYIKSKEHSSQQTDSVARRTKDRRPTLSETKPS